MSDELSRRFPPIPGRPHKRGRENIHQMHLGPLSPPAGGPSLILPDRNRLAQDLERPPRGTPPVHNVIDLTDSPPPIRGLRGHANRFGPGGQTEVIDVDALPDQSQQDIGLFLAQDVAQGLLAGPSRLRLGGLQHRFSPPRPIEPHALYSQVEEGMRFQPRFFQEIEDPILGHMGRARQQPESANGFFASPNRVGQYPAVANVLQFLRGVGRGPTTTEYPDLALPQQPPMGGPGFQPPGQLDYRRRAPGIIREDSPVIEDVIRTRNVDYKAPPPARDGFTRTPKDDDILVCSDCEVELGVESPDPSNEVWASKCGHCYCGACVVKFRATTLTKTGNKRRAKQKHCVVCFKSNLATKSNMIKIHL